MNLDIIRGMVGWELPRVVTLDDYAAHLYPARTVRFRDASVSHGDWVHSVPFHRLGPTGEFRMGLQPVRNIDFWRFVESGGYDDDSLWEKSVPRRSFITSVRSPGPAAWRTSSAPPPAEIEQHPVAGICFHEARAFCRWLNKVMPVVDWTWTLPTEDMWEYTARCRRGEKPTLYPWGDLYERGRCNSAEENLGGTSDAQRFHRGASADGCLDMAGNVWEFVEQAASTRYCTLRGGSFKNNQFEIQSLLRLHEIPRTHRAEDFGFRCACVRNSKTPRSETRRAVSAELGEIEVAASAFEENATNA